MPGTIMGGSNTIMWVPGIIMWVPGIIMGAWYHHGWLVPSWVAGLKDKKRVAQKWSNSLSELLRRLMSYLLADGSN
jgi:hypothetical protein